MHVPDGFLDLRTAAATALLSASGVGAALRRLQSGLPRRRVPLMGLAAAFVFAAQMVNFPVAAGTSGHLLGGTLVAIALGPAAGVVVMTAVLVVQCLLFADGGVLALGANVLNLGVVAVVGGWAVFRTVRRLLPGPRGFLAATAFASWCSTVLAAVGCAAELAWSGVAPWRLVFPAMAGVHMLVGLGEGVITTLVVAAIRRTRPDLLTEGPGSGEARSYRVVIGAGVAVVLAVLALGVPLASRRPDGLERVAEDLGFAGRGLGSATAATVAAGAVGAVVVFVLSWALAGRLVPRRTAPAHRPTLG